MKIKVIERRYVGSTTARTPQQAVEGTRRKYFIPGVLVLRHAADPTEAPLTRGQRLYNAVGPRLGLPKMANYEVSHQELLRIGPEANPGDVVDLLACIAADQKQEALRDSTTELPGPQSALQRRLGLTPPPRRTINIKHYRERMEQRRRHHESE